MVSAGRVAACDFFGRRTPAKKIIIGRLGLVNLRKKVRKSVAQKIIPFLSNKDVINFSWMCYTIQANKQREQKSGKDRF